MLANPLDLEPVPRQISHRVPVSRLCQMFCDVASFGEFNARVLSLEVLAEIKTPGRGTLYRTPHSHHQNGDCIGLGRDLSYVACFVSINCGGQNVDLISCVVDQC